MQNLGYSYVGYHQTKALFYFWSYTKGKDEAYSSSKDWKCPLAKRNSHQNKDTPAPTRVLAKI